MGAMVAATVACAFLGVCIAVRPVVRVSLPAKSSRGSHGGDLSVLERRQEARRGAGGTLKVTGVTPRVLMTTPRTENDLLHNVHRTAIS